MTIIVAGPSVVWKGPCSSHPAGIFQAQVNGVLLRSSNRGLKESMAYTPEVMDVSSRVRLRRADHA